MCQKMRKAVTENVTSEAPQQFSLSVTGMNILPALSSG